MVRRRGFVTGLFAVGCAGTSRRRAPQAEQALFGAIARGDRRTVAALLDAEPNLLAAVDGRGRSTFTAALVAGAPAVADLLRARGYRTDLVESAWVGDWDRFDRLATEHPELVNAPHPIGGPAMYAAARGGRGSEIWRVYARGALPDDPSRDPDRFSALRAAFEHPDLATAEMTAANLLANAADADSREPGGSSPLHAAARRGSAELVRMLVRKRADVAAVDREGRTAADVADEHGQREVVALLREHEAIARDHVALRHAFDVEGRPYRAVDLSDVSLVEQGAFTGMGHANRAGIEAGLRADPRLVHAAATTGEMAVEAATHVGRLEIAELLLDHGAPLPMPTAVLRGDVAAVARLLDAAPDRVHERGPHDFALLWYAVIGGGSIEMAQLLTQRGANVEVQSHLGTTALHFAAMSGQVEMVAFLLEQGADVHRVGRKFDATGQTALDHAVAEGHREVAALLEERGARGR
jgi:ankyrin repeat protein